MARQRESDPFQAAVTMGKTGWFYAALIASMVALVLAVAREYSPRLVIGTDGALRLRFPVRRLGGAPPAQSCDVSRVRVVSSSRRPDSRTGG